MPFDSGSWLCGVVGLVLAPQQLSLDLVFVSFALPGVALTRLDPSNDSMFVPPEIETVITFTIRDNGFEYYCKFVTGNCGWLRDTHAIYVPGAVEKILQFWRSTMHPFTMQQLRDIQHLPQYMFEEGDSLLSSLEKNVSHVI